MRAFVRTWRYNMETTLAFHGASATYDPSNAVLRIRKPVLDSDLGLDTFVTIVSGDEFTTERCPSECLEHPNENSLKDNDRLSCVVDQF